MSNKPLMACLIVCSLAFSGCFGLFSNEEDELTTTNEPPVLNVNLVNDVDWNELILVSGSVSDEDSSDVRVTVSFSIPWGTIYVQTDDNGQWEVPMNGLEPGEYSVTVSAMDNEDLESEYQTFNFTVLPPEEADVTLQIWRDEIWFDEEELQITGQLTHRFLDSCELHFTWLNGTSTINTIQFNADSGMLAINLGEIGDEGDGIIYASCGKYTNSSDSQQIYFFSLEGDSDSDGDGIPDDADDCPEGYSFSSSPITDHDGDGCYDLNEDTDDDNDGVLDSNDDCQKGETGWISNPITDVDGDGCRDTTEDDDDDGDSILDEQDSCLTSPLGWISTFSSDYDRDGCADESEDLDDDNDFTLDELDLCPKGVIGWQPNLANDRDSDGCRDSDEDTDDDNDGTTDLNDSCPETLPNYSVNEYGCAAYEWDDDGDGVMDEQDLCQGTPIGIVVNEQGCADLDNDGVFANVDICPDTLPKWTPDADGCSVIQQPVTWNSGPYSNSRYGIAGDFTFQTKYDGTWQFSNEWDGNSTYIFIFVQSSNSYMSALWNQNVGDLLSKMPENGHIFFGSYDSDWQSDVDAMATRVNSYRGSQTNEQQSWVDENVHFVYQQAGSISGGLGNVISTWNQFYYGIDRFQQWREIGSLYNWAKTLTSQPDYRFDYIANEPNMWESEFPVEMRRHDPSVTAVDLFVGERHSGGWSGGYTTRGSTTLPTSTQIANFNTLEVYLEHSCSEHRDRYGIDDNGDGQADRYGGCHEWDYLHYLKICDEDNGSICGTEFVRYITTYGREGRWITDISPLLWMIKNGGDRNFTYQGANGGWLNVTLLFSTWDDDGLRPVHGEVAFTGGKFNSNYNNESMYDRRFDVNTTSQWDKVEIAAIVTGHGFGSDPNNCAEFCNHEHFFELNGNDVTHDFPMAGNNSVASQREGCANTVDKGTVANQKGSWPFGRAGWCAGLDVQPWLHDITDWVNWAGPNEILYQGLWNGQQYTETNNNPDIRALVWVVYYENTSNIGPSFDSNHEPSNSESTQSNDYNSVPNLGQSGVIATDEREVFVKREE